MPDDTLHDDLGSIWRRVKEDLEASLPASTFRLWIAPLHPVSVQGPTLYVAAPEATRPWVERRYSATLEGALRRQDRGLDRVELVHAGHGDRTASGERESISLMESLPVDPRHTFERFVIGDRNRLAHAAALAVAELPGEAYNPLFLHGPPGLGKTHLLGAIIEYLRRNHAELTAHYTTAERFTTEFVTALRKDGPERFKQRYRGLDALLIDDVQVLEGKEQTQEEFVHTFNALHAAGKQIVLSSDRPPEALARLAERLRDRFQWGLCVQLAPPDLRTRTALVWKLAKDAPVNLPEPAVLGEIASLAAGNVRRLEGAMTRVVATSSVLGKPVTRGLVRRALADHSARVNTEPTADTAAPSVARIQDTVCSLLNVSQRDLLSTKRTVRVAQARQLAIYLTRELTSLSLAEIARAFLRDHSTVLHAIRTTASRLEPESETAALLDRARDLLQPIGTGITEEGISPHASSPPPRTPSTATPPDRAR